jgi:hypothetical protein
MILLLLYSDYLGVNHILDLNSQAFGCQRPEYPAMPLGLWV